MERDLNQTLDFFLGLGKERLKGLKLALDGDLGAGKTHFVRALLERIEPGASAQAASPSFGLCHHYETPDFLLDHFDLYRLDDPDQLEETGLFDSLDDPERISLVEWAQLFPEVYGRCDFRLLIAESGGSRVFRIQSIDGG